MALSLSDSHDSPTRPESGASYPLLPLDPTTSASRPASVLIKMRGFRGIHHAPCPLEVHPQRQTCLRECTTGIESSTYIPRLCLRLCCAQKMLRNRKRGNCPSKSQRHTFAAIVSSVTNKRSLAWFRDVPAALHFGATFSSEFSRLRALA